MDKKFYNIVSSANVEKHFFLYLSDMLGKQSRVFVLVETIFCLVQYLNARPATHPFSDLAILGLTHKY
jgi:hypothetical protein